MTGATQDGTPIYDAAKAPVDTLELTQGNGWSDTTIQLPTKDEDGNDIAYVAVEQAVTGYRIVTPAVQLASTAGNIITNVKDAEKEITVTKE